MTVDYSRDGWERQVRDAVGEVNVVFDGVGGDIGLATFGLLGAVGFVILVGAFKVLRSEPYVMFAVAYLLMFGYAFLSLRSWLNEPRSGWPVWEDR